MSEHNSPNRPQTRHNNRPQGRHNSRPNYGSNERKKTGIRGHDAALFGLVKSEADVLIFLNSPLKLPLSVSKVDVVRGKLVQYDAYTVTMKVGDFENPLILFKSSIGGLMKADR